MSFQPEFGFIIEYVQNVDEAMRFYVDVLGLKVQRYHPTYVQFEHFAIASDQSLSGTREYEAYWLVTNAQQAFDELSSSAEVVLPLTQKPFGKVFGIKDPTGKTIFLLEFAQNRPSQTVE